MRTLSREPQRSRTPAHLRLEAVARALRPARTIGFVVLAHDTSPTARANVDLRLAAVPAIVRVATRNDDAYAGWTDRPDLLDADANAAGYRVVERLDDGFARLVRLAR